jgi:Flp pilus assembly pilin Flp
MVRNVPSQASPIGHDLGGREVNPVLTFSDLVELLKAARKREEGQTMAEYAVVLAVITVATVAVFTALSGGISGAINKVTGVL